MRGLIRLSPLLIAFLTILPLGAPARAQATKAAAVNGWTAAPFQYDRPKALVVEQATPTPAQTALWPRPPEALADAPAPKATGPAMPRVVGPANVIHLRFQDATGAIVPALLCTPREQKGPFPVVIAIHGLTSNKAQVCLQVAPALLARGFAVLAADLPDHGERPGTPLDIFAKAYENGRQAVIETRQLIDLAEARADLDTKPGVVLVGYSLGTWIASLTGPADPRVKALVLMVGGTLPTPLEEIKDPQAIAIEMRLSLPHFAPRPVLLLNGKTDPIVHADATERLWAAAAEPRKQLWYDGGHLLPSPTYQDAAQWIAQTMKAGRPAAK